MWLRHERAAIGVRLCLESKSSTAGINRWLEWRERQSTAVNCLALVLIAPITPPPVGESHGMASNDFWQSAGPGMALY